MVVFFFFFLRISPFNVISLIYTARVVQIIFFTAKDGEALYSQQKQDWELTVAHIMSSLLPNSDLN